MVCYRRGSVLSAVVILAGGLSGRRQRIPWRSRGGICRVCERWRKAVSSDGNSLPLRPSVIFAAILPGLRPKGLTRRREDAKKGGADGLLFGEDVACEMRTGGFQSIGGSGIPDRRRWTPLRLRGFAAYLILVPGRCREASRRSDAGDRGRESVAPPGLVFTGGRNPALTRWAIIWRPSGPGATAWARVAWVWFRVVGVLRG